MEKIVRKWRATIISLPIAVIMFFLAAISTGAGHGSSVIVYLYYAPLHALGKLSLTIFGELALTTDNFLFSIFNTLLVLILWFVFIFLHPIYAILADLISNRKMHSIFFWVLMGCHYLAFAYLLLSKDVFHREFEQRVFFKAYQFDSTFFIVCFFVFLCWQFFLAWRIYKSTFQDSSPELSSVTL